MATGSELPLHSTFIRAILLPPETFPRPRQDVNDSLSFYDHDATQSECAHRLRCTVVLVTIVVYIILHYTMEKKMAAGWSLQYEVGRHIKVQRSSFRLNVVLLIIMIIFFRAFI